MKEKVVLKNEMETLLIPLYCRARMAERGFITDRHAEEAIRQIDYDFSRLHIPVKLQIFMAIREKIFENITKNFLQKNPGAVVLSLGSGLSAGYARVTGYGEWIDLDFPEVIGLRDKLLPPFDRHRSIASSVTDWSWLDQVKGTEAEVLILAEGLLMYLEEREVQELFHKLTSAFPNATFAFDAFSGKTVQRIKWQSSLRKTGARVQWGVETPLEIQKLEPRIQWLRTVYLTEEEYTEQLGAAYRLLFRLAAKIRTAKEAHRVFVFRAGGSK